MAFGEGSDDETLKAAWDAFCDRLKQAGALAFKDANPASGIHRADAFRFLTQNLGQAFDLALETRDPAFPQIHYFTTPTMKLGGDVADFTYRQAWISGAYQYRITGRRGTARWFNLTVQGPRPERMGNGALSLHEPFGDIPECNIFGHQIETDANGNFELFIGGQERGPNWLPTTPGSRKLFIREAFDAWDESPTTLSIERVGMAEPRPMATPADMIEAFDWAGKFLEGLMEQWPEHSWANSAGVVDPDRPNEFPPDKAANDCSDAKRGRMAAHMVWQLERDEALIVEMDDHDGFWIFGMGGPFMGSMDFLHRPVSYTPARTAVGADNVVRFVIAHHDPGIATWLDTQGFERGNLTYRNLMSQNPAHFRTKLVKVSELDAHLPPETIRLTPFERVEEMRRRHAAIRRRFGF